MRQNNSGIHVKPQKHKKSNKARSAEVKSSQESSNNKTKDQAPAKPQTETKQKSKPKEAKQPKTQAPSTKPKEESIEKDTDTKSNTDTKPNRESAIESLMGMGFTRQHATDALVHTHNDVEAAVDYLLKANSSPAKPPPSNAETNKENGFRVRIDNLPQKVTDNMVILFTFFSFPSS